MFNHKKGKKMRNEYIVSIPVDFVMPNDLESIQGHEFTDESILEGMMKLIEETTSVELDKEDLHDLYYSIEIMTVGRFILKLNYDEIDTENNYFINVFFTSASNE